MSTQYIQRRLAVNSKYITEEEAISSSDIIIVLAEPGAGKTELLDYFARSRKAKRHRASIFSHKDNFEQTSILIIDALDEVARQDETAVDRIIVKAFEKNAEKTIFASRSYVWSNERNKFIEDCSGKKPLVLRLEPFNENEQRLLFQNNFPEEDFSVFRNEAIIYGLEQILGNPMFFKLFVEGYIQNGRTFQSKRRIFHSAIERLAQEDNKNKTLSKRPPISEIVDVASELFAKILLSGASGISISERLDDYDYPYVNALSTYHVDTISCVLNSRLFKPNEDADTHEPIHRIVAEYCAAQYLVKRLTDLSDTFSLRRLLAIISPNLVIRDELRGLLGWLAALGNEKIQVEIIKIDPYAVLANGDPSQLTAKSKKLLLQRLDSLSNIDPYFRNADRWRQFNVSGFFTNDVMDELRLILAKSTDESHLRGLILELLQGEQAAQFLVPELRAIMLDQTNDLTNRLLANGCLKAVETYDAALEDFKSLLSEATPNALINASELISGKLLDPPDNNLLLELFHSLANAKPKNNRNTREIIDLKLSIKDVTSTITFEQTCFLLDNLTEGLQCTCGARDRYLCHCREEISKIVSYLLDRYFDVGTTQHVPEKIWGWIKNLKFEKNSSSMKSTSALVLKKNDSLRQSIQLLALKDQNDPEKIWKTIRDLNWGKLHQSLFFSSADYEVIVDYAFNSNNPVLWIAFAPPHKFFAEERGPNPLRAKMRHQALEKKEFMREWVIKNRLWKKVESEEGWTSRGQKRREHRQSAIQEENFAFLKNNREMIEKGQHFGFNHAFAQRYLYSPKELNQVVDDIKTAENALIHSLNFLLPKVPTLPELANREKINIAEVLHAGCLVKFRKTGTLSDIDKKILQCVKTEVRQLEGYSDEEEKLLEEEIDTQIFNNERDVETFAKEFIEPNILNSSEGPHNLHWLESKSAFEPLSAKLSSEWLDQDHLVSPQKINELFDMCARCSDQNWLTSLIKKRCKELTSNINHQENEESKSRKEFWFLRHFFFLDQDENGIWDDVLSKREGIFSIASRSDRFERYSSAGWPNLNSEKIYAIFDAYIEKWPKVYLPSSWGSGSPKDETAYRFLTNLIWDITKDENSSRAIRVINTMLKDSRFEDFRNDLLSIKASTIRKHSLKNFETPLPGEIVSMLDSNEVATVEDLRSLIIEEFDSIQKWLQGTDTDPLDMFWLKGERIDEIPARNRIVEFLQRRLPALDISANIEHHMSNSNRCDFTVTKMINGKRRLLVCEVKGQWHQDLFTAIEKQLNERYAIHPDAKQQGIFLALWFGPNEKVANRKKHNIKSAEELRIKIFETMPEELQGFIDIYVMNLSKN